MSKAKIVFNKPFCEPDFIKEATKMAENSSFCSNEVDQQVMNALEQSGLKASDHNIYFTQSATQSLEIMALALDLKAGDEVIMPSYTYAATANAFARTGAKLIFADVDLKTINITPKTVEPLITDKTRAVLPIHYGGGAAEVEGLRKMAERNNFLLLEDAAHGIGAKFNGQALGTFGEFGCFSFHHTKNITAFGNGGLLIVNNRSKFYDAVDQVYYQGTDRSAFLRGEASEYRWMTLGGEYEMAFYNKLYLNEALKRLKEVTTLRTAIWHFYHNRLSLELSDYINDKRLILPTIIEGAEINGHIYHLILPSKEQRNRFMHEMMSKSIAAYSHYEPLHLSPAGQKYGEVRASMASTECIGNGLVRLPLYPQLSDGEQNRIVEAVIETIKTILR